MSRAKEAATKASEAQRSIAQIIHGYDEATRLLMVALATGGHVIIEGVPGLGKTMMAKTFAAVTGMSFNRVQLTPDLMPTDITGHSFFNQSTSKFEVREGPVFTNLLLADEINRAPPRTQSALLEVMEEGQVSIDTETLFVPDPFLVVATKNPIDIEGVYPLPEAQLDRFMFMIRLEYPERDVEKGMLLGKLAPTKPVQPVAGLVPILRAALADVRAHDDIVSYVLDIVRATREMPDTVELGAGPRAAEQLLKASRGYALIQGRDYVIPDDVKAVAPHVLAHRLMLTADAEIGGAKQQDAITQVLDTVPVPIEVSEAR